MGVYPDEPTALVVTVINSFINNSVHFYDAAAHAWIQYPAIVDAGWASYGFINPCNTAVPGVGSTFYIDWFGFRRNETQIVELATPIAEYINATWPDEFQVYVEIFTYPLYYEWWSKNNDPGAYIGVNLVAGLRLLDKKAPGTPNLTSYIQRSLRPGGQLTEYILDGPGIHSKSLSLNAVCPAWRTAYSHSVTDVGGWSPGDTTAEAQQLNLLNGYAEALAELVPDTGAYINES